MPMPVSRTAISIWMVSAFWARNVSSSDTSPRSVNLIAFESRLSSTWRVRIGSPTTRMDPDKGTWTTSRRPFSAALSANKPNELLDRLSQIEVDVFKLELTRLELREIQDVIDEREQVAAGALDDRGQPSLPSGQFGGEEQFGRADDAVHRGFESRGSSWLFLPPGRPEGFHLQPPTEPCVNLSTYTARLNYFSRNLTITGLRGKMIAPLDFSIGEDFL